MKEEGKEDIPIVFGTGFGLADSTVSEPETAGWKLTYLAVDHNRTV